MNNEEPKTKEQIILELDESILETIKAIKVNEAKNNFICPVDPAEANACDSCQ